MNYKMYSTLKTKAEAKKIRAATKPPISEEVRILFEKYGIYDTFGEDLVLLGEFLEGFSKLDRDELEEYSEALLLDKKNRSSLLDSLSDQ